LLHKEALKIPNLLHHEVPLDKEKVLREVGVKKEFSFPFQDHFSLAQSLDLIDFESAALATGEKFYYLKV
jgi:seryl-tRNA synthetase